MNWLRQLIERRQIYRDLNEEIEQHLAEKVEALMADGMSLEKAEATARRAFGNLTRMNERGREAWMWPRIESVVADVRFALRKLRRSPGFALTAMITLALGIGANVVVFSIINGLIWHPLAVPEPANVFQVFRAKQGGDSQSYPDYRDFRDRDKSFSGLVATKYMRAGLTVGKSTMRSWGLAVSGNYFDVLGVQPAVGRFLHAGDERGLGSAPYIVLSNDFWRRQFNSNASVVGQTVELNQHSFTVVGVAGRDFSGTSAFYWPDYWIPIANAEQVTGWSDYCCRDHVSIEILGRLKPGVTPEQATASLNSLSAQMAKEDPKDEGLAVRVREPGPAGDETDPTKKALLGIMLLALLVLLAACANLASIFAVRAADRSRELAIRLAIGSTRWVVLRQLLTEAVIVSSAGGIVGSYFARLLLSALSHWQAFGDVPTHFGIAPDTRVYLVALGLSVASGILFGLLPARQVWRTEVVQAIKAGYMRSDSFRRFALRDLLLVVQIVVCTLLVTASLVAVRGLMLGFKLPLAIEPEGVTVAQSDLSMAGYTGPQSLPVQRRMLDAAAAIPGVTSAAVSDAVPFMGGGGWFVYKWGTTEFLPARMAFAANTYLISPGYLHTAGTQLLEGRDFSWNDNAKSPKVAIVNRTFARKLYGDAPAIGQRFALWATAKYQVVGVVEDGKYQQVSEDPQPAMFIPLAQGVGEVMSTSTSVVVRSQLPESQIAPALQRALAGVEPGAPILVTTWADAIDRTMALARAAAMVLSVMGMLAAMLAITGTFGMASYSVSKRTKEQGIRMALGAGRIEVLRASLHRPVLLLFAGSVAGIGAGLLATRVLAHLVSFATPRDPLVLAGVLLTMMSVGVVATWIPARRALGIDPARLLRE